MHVRLLSEIEFWYYSTFNIRQFRTYWYGWLSLLLIFLSDIITWYLHFHSRHLGTFSLRAYNENNTHIQRWPVLWHLLDPHDGVIKLRVYGLQVFERGFFVQHALVEGQRESCVDELSVVQSLQGGFVTLETTIRNVSWYLLNLVIWQVWVTGSNTVDRRGELFLLCWYLVIL